MNRRKIKARRAARAATPAQVVVEAAAPEGVAPMPDDNENPVKPGPVPVPIHERLPDDEMLEIGQHYQNLDIPMEMIARAYSLSNNALMQVVDHLGLPRRSEMLKLADQKRGRGFALPPGHFDRGDGWHRAWVYDDEAPSPNGTTEIVSNLPEPVEQALEKMIVEPDRSRVPPALHQRAVPREHVTADDDESLPVWQIKYEGSMLVRAIDIDQALQRAREDGHLVQIIGIIRR